jgi:uncharacterized protein YjbI with pentapeptide repeats
MIADDRVWRPSEIVQRYLGGDRDFQGLDISDPDGEDPSPSFRGAILDGADFSRSFVLADFRAASLRACKFVEANVKTCCFDGASLQGCDFSRAAIDAATFRAAQLEGACFDGAGAYGHTAQAGELPTWDTDA